MKRLKISPTLLNSFGMYLDESLEWFDYDRLMEGITKPFVQTDEMKYGEACHWIVENFEPSAFDQMYSDGRGVSVKVEDGSEVIVFNQDARAMMDFKREHPNGVFEQRHKKTYQVGEYEVVVSMKVDMIEYNTVFDFKITGSQVKSETYLKAYQWRCYLDAMELPYFEYRVWQKRRNGLVPFEPIKCYRTESTPLRS